MKIKRVICLLIAGVMCLSVAACGGSAASRAALPAASDTTATDAAINLPAEFETDENGAVGSADAQAILNAAAAEAAAGSGIATAAKTGTCCTVLDEPKDCCEPEFDKNDEAVFDDCCNTDEAV